MNCIYFVEDSPFLLEDGLLWLQHEGFDAHGAISADGLEILLQKKTPDLILLDWNLPGKDGLDIAKKLKNDDKTKHIYIIFVTARDAMDDRILGLNLADAYITKPFDYRELLATIHACLRRLSATSEITVNHIWQHFPAKHCITIPNGNNVSLTEKESLILKLFSRYPKKIITPQMIHKEFQESLYIYEKNRIEVIISRLRNKLKMDEDNPIRSFRNKGYQLSIELEIMTEE